MARIWKKLADLAAGGAWLGSSAAPHDAPELEVLLPSVMNGQELAIWSKSSGSFRYAVAGRANVVKDPPYFVFVTAIPQDSDEKGTAAVGRLTALAGFDGMELVSVYGRTLWKRRSVRGRKLEVWIGTAEMLRQDEHQRGNPYYYAIHGHAFVFVTESPAWAREALEKTVEAVTRASLA